MLACSILAAVLLLCIGYEDFAHRAVRLIWYLLLPVALLPLRFSHVTLEEFGISTLMNIVYMVLLLAVAFGVLYMRNKRLVAPLSTIGLGDILFFAILAMWFDTPDFIIFTSLSFIVALVGHTLLRKFSFYRRHETVPLAGMQSLCFLVIFLTSVEWRLPWI
jgi:hypothetical protein